MKEQIKTPEKVLSDEQIANLLDAEFKTLVIRLLTEMIECGCKIKEEVKAIQSEIKKNIQGPTVKRRKPYLNQQYGIEGRNKHLKKIFLLFNYSCVSFLPNPPTHTS